MTQKHYLLPEKMAFVKHLRMKIVYKEDMMNKCHSSCCYFKMDIFFDDPSFQMVESLVLPAWALDIPE